MKPFISKIKLVCIWILIILGFDFFLGSLLLDNFYHIPNEARIRNEVFHHTLKENVNVKDYWGSFAYDLCTNQFGFKNNCDDLYYGNDFDIAFIGDSFTEGVGLNY